MAAVNPYQAPSAAVADTDDKETQPVRLFAVSGRIGRARYITYTMGVYILFLMIGGALGAALGTVSQGLTTVVVAVAWVAFLVVAFMLTIQRCHDFNASGWLSLLVLVPLVNLMFWFIPGTRGKNRFGAQTPPNSVFTLVLVWIFPALVIVGIVAAVAIPAYQQYQVRAQQKAR